MIVKVMIKSSKTDVDVLKVLSEDPLLHGDIIEQLTLKCRNNQSQDYKGREQD